MKTCSKCGISKQLENFYKNKRCKDGVHYTCKECVSNITKTDDYKSKRRKRYNKNPPKRKITDKSRATKQVYDVIYRQENFIKIREYKKEWEFKRKNDPIFKIKRNLRRRIHHAIKDNYKSDHTMNLLGCSVQEFKEFIEKQFTTGMSWDNYGEWHIDHIVECFRFDLSKESEQRKCFHYSNQRPLWAKDNLTRKRNPKIPTPESLH